jgi:signal transduction histidine kinase
VLAALLAWRATGLGTGVASVLGGAGRYRSRVVALGQLGAGLAESAWLAGRLSRRDRWDDPVAAAVDAGTAVGLLALSRGNLAAAERGTWINWVPWSFAASAVSAQAMAEHRPARRAAGVAAITAAHAAQGPAPGDAIANSVAQAGFAVGAWFLAAQTRAGAVRLAVARAAAVEQGRRLAQARERGTQLRLLHDSALQTLEAVAGGRYHDRAALSERASAEARLLARALEGRGPSARLELLLAAVAEQQRARGLQVELDAADLPPLPDEVGEALAAACHEALTNVAKHAGVTTARVQVRAQAGGIMLMVEDGGAGFEPHTMGRGFGMAESVHGRMREVGGLAEVRSRPGVGTRVLLRWPA